MDDILSQLRAEITRLRAQAGPGELRLYEHVGSRILSHLPTWRNAGMTYVEIAKALGVSDTAIHVWRRRGGLLPERVSPREFVRVEVASSRPTPVHVSVSPSPLSLLCPSGHRLEGLDLTSAITVIKALS